MTVSGLPKATLSLALWRFKQRSHVQENAVMFSCKALWAFVKLTQIKIQGLTCLSVFGRTYHISHKLLVCSLTLPAGFQVGHGIFIILFLFFLRGACYLKSKALYLARHCPENWKAASSSVFNTARENHVKSVPVLPSVAFYS